MSVRLNKILACYLIQFCLLKRWIYYRCFKRIFSENMQASATDVFLYSKLVSKICTLMGSFWRKYIMFELKKYRGVMFHDTEEWGKIWRGIDLSFPNWHEEFDASWPEHSKVSKICTLMGSFWRKYTCLS